MSSSVTVDFQQIVRSALAEDLGAGHPFLADKTTQALANPTQPTRARFTAKQDGVVAGLNCVREVFHALDPSVVVELLVDDGARVRANDTIATVEGEAQVLLAGERTALNFVSHLSGVATLTRQFVDAAFSVAIYDTRKTTPGLRQLEKLAVIAGGGHSNRESLSEAILIKDNHLVLETDIAALVKRAKASGETVGIACASIVVECESVDEVKAAVTAGADGILIDNRSIAQTKELVSIARSINPSIIIEASGGITLTTVSQVATTGIDRISVGALTHSAPALDISMAIECF